MSFYAMKHGKREVKFTSLENFFFSLGDLTHTHMAEFETIYKAECKSTYGFCASLPCFLLVYISATISKEMQII